MDVRRLSVQVRRTRRGSTDVRLLVDDEDLLAAFGRGEGNTVEDILDSGALLPSQPPRRIALYGCMCGDFGCGQVAMLVARSGDRITWTDAMSVTGEYGSALPIEGPDPVPLLGEDDFLARPLDLPDLVFDADEYIAEVERATAEHT